MAIHTFLDEGDERQYWTQIPNIVFTLGLKPTEFVLYSHIKRAAGAGRSGRCTKSRATLAKECSMGTGSVTRARIALEQPRALLGNKSLIRTKELPNPSGGKPYLEITVTDIWRENTTRFTTSTRDVEGVTTSTVDIATSKIDESNVHSGHKEEQYKKNLYKEEELSLADLKKDPAYSHVDVSHEFQKAERWCALNRRKLTPRFFVNWLNKIDRPFRPIDDPGTKGNGHDAAWHKKQAELARRLGREYRPDAAQS